MLNIVKILAIGILFAALGHLCAGCDGTTESGDGTGSNPCLDPQVVIVTSAILDSQFSSPTSDPIMGAQRQCIGWTADKVMGSSNPVQCAFITMEYGPGMTMSTAQAECAVVMTQAECADTAHDFVDTAGVKHGYRVDSGQLVEFGILFEDPTDATGHFPICTTGGVYIGHLTNSSCPTSCSH